MNKFGGGVVSFKRNDGLVELTHILLHFFPLTPCVNSTFLLFYLFSFILLDVNFPPALLLYFSSVPFELLAPLN